ncbi:MAG: hypothetical protein ABI647_16625 [Gemmatimonadota bacterium]
MTVLFRSGTALLAGALWATSLAGQARNPKSEPTGGPVQRRPHQAAVQAHNPPRVQASQVLGLVGAAGSPRVRFEWESVGGAHAYLLLGAITDKRTWRVTNTEHRVSAVNAAEWSPDRVVYETPLNPGLYSWRVVALFAPNDIGDFAMPAVVTFEVR